MLGYVRNICDLPNGLTYVLDSATGRKEYRVKKRTTPLRQTIYGDVVYSSVHYRGSNASRQTSNLPIALHHLWLKTEEPCENTRCKTST